MRYFVLRARYSEVERVAATLVEALPEALRTDSIGVGLVEALSNAIVHGALQLPARGADADELERYLDALERVDEAPVTLWASVGEGRICIYDGGPGFDWRSEGRGPDCGLAIIRRVFEEVQWNEAGNLLNLTVTTRVGPER